MMMFKNAKIPLLVLGLVSQVTIADDGAKTYKMMCASCHGAQGEGVGGGAFPPLKDSEWLKTNPNRVAQILLHGLTGPVSVKGKVYNLTMPAQGALSDQQKVDVINYIRNEFAGEDAKFTAKDLMAAKSLSGKRTKPWTADELLKLYPFPRAKSPIKNLLMTTYKGSWEALPDFSQLEGEAIEEEHDGYISLKNINKASQFGVVWEGDLEILADGVYEFELNSDDGSRLEIDGKGVTKVKGLGAMNRPKRGKAKLTKGLHKIKVMYFQQGGGQGISLRWKPAKSKKWMWLSDIQKTTEYRPPVVIDISPKGSQVRMYNNFIAGSSHRTMAVGFSNKNNIAFSLQDGGVAMIWRGDFISAGRHWTGRGQGAQAPLSKEVIKLGQGMIWSKDGNAVPVQLKGYTMDKQGSPTFKYTVGAMLVSESFRSEPNKLTRTVTVESGQEQNVSMQISAQGELNNNKLKIGTLTVGVDKQLALIADKGKMKTILPLKKGTNTYNFEYIWNN